MFKKVILLALVLPAFMLSGAYGLEELLFEDFEVVFSAARMEQPIAESPAAITVITEEQIKQSGAMSIPEVLRQVVGLSVIQVTVGEYQISSRGFDKIPGNKMAYLVDGVPMITYAAYDAPVWDLLPITVEDISRIEVIRGPGSSLYGSNAMLGVINVITKDPADTTGGSVAASAGELGTLRATARYGGVTDNYSYRVGANYLAAEEFGPMPILGVLTDQEIDTASAMMKLDYYTGPESTLSLFTGYSQGDGAVAYETTGYMNTSDFMKLDFGIGYNMPGTDFNLYVKYLDIGAVELLGADIPFEELYAQAEVRRTERIGNHTLIGGIEYSHNAVETGLFDRVPGESDQESLDAVAFYLQDDFRVLDQLLLNASMRYDYNEIAEGHFTTRASAIYLPNDMHSLRFTYGTSYRNPNFIEYFYEANMPHTEATLLMLPPPPGETHWYYSVDGREENDPEVAESYELGYRGSLSENLELGANVFYMKVKDFTALLPTEYWDTSYLVPFIGAAPDVPKVINHINTGEAEQYGGEIELRYRLTDWLGGFVNYTYLEPEETKPFIAERLLCTARNRANAGVNFSFDNGLSANLLVHYSDMTRWPLAGAEEWGAGGKADAYTIVNMRIGYELPVGDNLLELSVHAFNLLDEEHSQYPIESAPLTRKVTGTVAYRF